MRMRAVADATRSGRHHSAGWASRQVTHTSTSTSTCTGLLYLNVVRWSVYRLNICGQ